MKHISVIGLGYVGLPLAVKFAKNYRVSGYDISTSRVEELRQGKDSTQEVDVQELQDAAIAYGTDPSVIADSDYVVVAIPTPVTKDKRPNLQPLLSGCQTIGEHLKVGTTVIFESTVYPRCTEDDCIPVLESASGMKYGKDFQVAYSPERINPGDKVNTVESIVKVVGANDSHTLEDVSALYSSIITAGVHPIQSIKGAEAAKIIENTQRDINIALMNEFKIICDKMDIDVYEVLEAAGTKWNFLKFHPGLVGGHCIGVDPYYLAEQSKKFGHIPEVILAGRHVNDNMAKYESEKIIKELSSKGNHLSTLDILVLGGSFKPDVPDMRNSKIEDVVGYLKEYGCNVDICEPYHTANSLFGVNNVSLEKIGDYDVVIKGVKHKIFSNTKVDYTLL